MVKNIFFFLIAFVIVSVTIYIPVTVYIQEDLSRVELGLPLPFMAQNQMNNHPPIPFPRHTNLEGFYNNATQIIWHYLLIDVIVVLGILKLSVSGLKLMRRRFYG